ncbi:hypothetical protein [Bacteriovorax sp. Seq25_V]|uniref:hypothetical protein n=1 Tax=Bacteriovorax sp. Seq25_V TaxID=1201288 RepID=UPI000389F500|nr:hypothetical protein [Bacteriovorax sp. Seq25_V]EQC45334.1 hypothetical protein M900_2169 [Bacteriovorax sp. Seq25_V]
MKKIFLTSLVGLATLLPLAAQAEAIKGDTGKFCPGAQVVKNLDGSYVERVFIAAEGIRNDGFIHVYADGVKVQRIGIPGYDPDYTFRIRRNVQELKLTFEGTCARVLDYKIFTPAQAPKGPRYSRDRAMETSWGAEVLNLIDGIDDSLVRDDLTVDPLYTNVLRPLKKIAMYERASENERNTRSLIKTLRALKMAEIIRDNRTYMFNKLENSEHEYLVADLLSILEDVLEHTDVKQNRIGETIKFLEEELAE